MKTKQSKSLEKLSDIELIKQYSTIISILKERKILKSKNTVSDMGRHYAIGTYNDNHDLPNLTPVQGVQNINAMSKQGERYCVKATTKAMTGLFYGLNDPESQEEEIKKFEYVVVSMLNEDYGLTKVVELSWEKLLEFKKWDKTRGAWYLSITKSLLSEVKTVFSIEESEKS